MNGLKFIRTQSNISLSNLAMALGVSRQMVSAWENDKKELLKKRVEQLSRYTDSHESFKYYQFINAETAEEFTAYVEKCKKLSLYETGVTAEYGDKLLTLSTCEYSQTNGRLVVVAKLIIE